MKYNSLLFAVFLVLGLVFTVLGQPGYISQIFLGRYLKEAARREQIGHLEEAVRGGQIEKVKEILSKVESRNFPDYKSRAYLYAATYGQTEIVKDLLKMKPLDFESPEWKALLENPESEALLKNSESERLENFESEALEIALKEAIRNGHTDIVKILFNKQLQGISKKRDQYIVQAVFNGKIEIVKVFLDNYSSITIKMALIAAAEKGRTEIIKFFLDNIPLASSLKYSSIPITLAIIAGHKETAKFLFESLKDDDKKQFIQSDYFIGGRKWKKKFRDAIPVEEFLAKHDIGPIFLHEHRSKLRLPCYKYNTKTKS